MKLTVKVFFKNGNISKFSVRDKLGKLQKSRLVLINTIANSYKEGTGAYIRIGDVVVNVQDTCAIKTKIGFF